MKRPIIAAMLAFSSALTFAELPRDSVYQLAAVMEDQDGHTRRWSANQGEVRIVTMFYSSCPHACPLIVETIKAAEAALSVAERSRLKVDLLSFDHERDTPAQLKKVAAQRSIDESRWHLYRTDDASARRLSGLLGVQYRKLADGEYNHSSVLILLDADGRILMRSNRIGVPDPKFVAAVRRALATSD